MLFDHLFAADISHVGFLTEEQHEISGMLDVSRYMASLHDLDIAQYIPMVGTIYQQTFVHDPSGTIVR